MCASARGADIGGRESEPAFFALPFNAPSRRKLRLGCHLKAVGYKIRAQLRVKLPELNEGSFRERKTPTRLPFRGFVKFKILR